MQSQLSAAAVAPGPQPPWGQGTVLGGRYRLESPIGRGAMGEVWHAVHLSLGTPVAIKLIHVVGLANGVELQSRFHQEARAAARLQSPHTVRIIDHGWEGPIAYIAMEMLKGESLMRRLERVRRLPVGRVSALVVELGKALSEAHAMKIIHRDIKPQNIFLTRVDGAEVAKLLDFGIAKVAGVNQGLHETNSGLLVGTPAYMSPEQTMGNQPIDTRSDVWQLGVVVYEAVTGRRPFMAEGVGHLFVEICRAPIPPPSQLVDVPPGFDAWMMKALARETGRRFQSVDEMAAALVRIAPPIRPSAAEMRASGSYQALDGVPATDNGMLRTTSQVAASAHDLLAPGSRRRRGMLISAIATTIVGCTVVTLTVLLPDSSTSPTDDETATPTPAAPLPPEPVGTQAEPVPDKSAAPPDTSAAPSASSPTDASAAPSAAPPPPPPKGVPPHWSPERAAEEILGI